MALALLIMIDNRGSWLIIYKYNPKTKSIGTSLSGPYLWPLLLFVKLSPYWPSPFIIPLIGYYINALRVYSIILFC
jgi:hypothetical protein